MDNLNLSTALILCCISCLRKTDQSDSILLHKRRPFPISGSKTLPFSEKFFSEYFYGCFLLNVSMPMKDNQGYFLVCLFGFYIGNIRFKFFVTLFQW